MIDHHVTLLFTSFRDVTWLGKANIAPRIDMLCSVTGLMTGNIRLEGDA